jgi:hypothetical protein
MVLSEIGDQVQPAAEGLDVAGDDLEGGELAVLDLGYPGNGHADGDGDLYLARNQLLAGLGELVPARLGEPNTLWRRVFLRSGPSVMPLTRANAAADSGGGRVHGWGNEPIK